jgi:hypothetical protein
MMLGFSNYRHEVAEIKESVKNNMFVSETLTAKNNIDQCKNASHR